MDLSKVNKKSFISKKDKNGKLYKNISNYGAKEGDITEINTKGEFYNFSVEWLEDVIPIFTVERIKRVLKELNKNINHKKES